LFENDWRGEPIHGERGTEMKVLIWIGLAACFAAAADAQQVEMIDFEIEDQLEQEHTKSDLLGTSTVVLCGDRHGSKFIDAWYDTLKATIEGHPEIKGTKIVELATLKGVPFFVKGKVKNSFPKNPDRPVLLDWKGKFAKAYDLEKDVCSILLFDARGRLVHREYVTEVDPEVLSGLSRRLMGMAVSSRGSQGP
jgi:hypothetical protein